MLARLWLTLIVLAAGAACCSSLRVLQLVPGFTNSHVLFNHRLAATVTGLGHDVTMWTQMELSMVLDRVLQSPKGVRQHQTDIHFHDKLQTEGLKVFQSMMFNASSTWALWWTGQQFRSMRLESCRQMLGSDVLARLRAAAPFDLVIGHFHDLCPVALAHQLGLDNRMVWVTHGTSLYDYTAQTMGLRTYPSYVPHPLSPFSDRMTFLQRTVNLLWHVSTLDFVNLPQNLLHEENQMYSEYTKDGKSLWKKASQVKILLLNGERFLDFPRPLPPGINFMGEITPMTKKKTVFDEQFQTILDETDKGVIIFSLGTVSNTSHLPDRMKFGFLNAFARFPEYTILWRLEMDLPEAKAYKHIRILRWLPQQDLMRDRRTRVLVAHGGYNSLLETAKAGVPCLLMPLFADQHINAERARQRGIGLVVDKLTVDANTIEHAIRRLLTEPRCACV